MANTLQLKLVYCFMAKIWKLYVQQSFGLQDQRIPFWEGLINIYLNKDVIVMYIKKSSIQRMFAKIPGFLDNSIWRQDYHELESLGPNK